MSTSNISWDGFKLGDLDLILSLMQTYYAYEGLEFKAWQASNVLAKFIINPELGQGWIIKVENESVGYIIMTNGFSIEFGGHYQFVDEFFIVEGQRRAGVGSETLKYVEDLGRYNGVKSLHLEVEHENKKAQSFYTKCDYHDHGRYLLSKDL